MINLLEIKKNSTGEYHPITVNKYRVDYKKNWGSQQRNLNGSTRGTLIGLQANVVATSEYLTQTKVEELVGLLNQSYFLVKFYDTVSNTVKEANYTASDVSAELVRLRNKEYRAISFTLTAVDMWVS